MESVLCIDLSASPASLLLVEVEGRAIRVTDRAEFDWPQGMLPSSLTEPSILDDHADTEVSPQDAHSTGVKSILSNAMREALSRIKGPFNESILLLPMQQYLSVNLTLPFLDKKSIAKIIEGEVRDLVPFEVDEFVLDSRATGVGVQGKHELHIALAPKILIRNSLELCRSIGLEPTIITTPASTLATLPKLVPDFFVGDLVLLSIQRGCALLTTVIGGVVRGDRCISTGGIDDTLSDALLSELKLSLMTIERKFQRTITTVHCDAPSEILRDLKQKLGRPIEVLDLNEFVARGASRHEALSALSALFVRDQTPLVPLCNFRVKEFIFKPRFDLLFNRLAPLRNIALATFGVFLLALIVTYMLRNYYIESVRAEMTAQILKIMPDLVLEEGNEARTFSAALNGSAKELENLGSPNSLSPLQVFAMISGDLDNEKSITAKRIDIRPCSVTVEVTLPDYAAADRLERQLKKHQSFLTVEKKSAGSASSTGRQQTFEIILCEKV